MLAMNHLLLPLYTLWRLSSKSSLAMNLCFFALFSPLCKYAEKWAKSAVFGHVSPPLLSGRDIHHRNASPSPNQPYERAPTGGSLSPSHLWLA